MIVFKASKNEPSIYFGLPPRPRNNRGKRAIYHKLFSLSLSLLSFNRRRLSHAYLKHVHPNWKKLPLPRRNQRAIVAEV